MSAGPSRNCWLWRTTTCPDDGISYERKIRRHLLSQLQDYRKDSEELGLPPCVPGLKLALCIQEVGKAKKRARTSLPCPVPKVPCNTVQQRFSEQKLKRETRTRWRRDKLNHLNDLTAVPSRKNVFRSRPYALCLCHSTCRERMGEDRKDVAGRDRCGRYAHHTQPMRLLSRINMFL